jgi:serine/threonine protein kinase
VALLDEDAFAHEYRGYRWKQLVRLEHGRAVVRAEKRTTGEPVIVKRILPGRYERELRLALFNEAHYLSVLRGSCVPNLVGIGTSRSGSPFLVVEELRGVSLDLLLLNASRQRHRPRISQVLELLDRLADSVLIIHGRGVAHGDITPANLVAEWGLSSSSFDLPPNGPIYLVDFEAAEFIDQDHLLDQKFAKGTVGFMAPERLWRTSLSAASDVYSCTALAALLLTGRPRSPGSNAADRVPSPELVSLLRKGLQVDPADRQRTIEEWQRELRYATARLSNQVLREPVRWPERPSWVEGPRSTRTVTAGARFVADFLRHSAMESGAEAPSDDAPMYLPFETLVDAMKRSLAGMDQKEKQATKLFGEGLGVREIASQLERQPRDVRRSLNEIHNRVQEEIEAAPEKVVASPNTLSRGLASLNPSERRVVELLIAGLDTREIASELAISRNSVSSVLRRSLRKLASVDALDVLNAGS